MNTTSSKDIIDRFTTEAKEHRTVTFPGSYSANAAVAHLENEGWRWWKVERDEDGTMRFWVRRGK